MCEVQPSAGLTADGREVQPQHNVRVGPQDRARSDLSEQ